MPTGMFCCSVASDFASLVCVLMCSKTHVFSLLAMIVDIGLSGQPHRCTSEATRVPMNMIHVDCNYVPSRARDTCAMHPPDVPLCGWEPHV